MQRRGRSPAARTKLPRSRSRPPWLCLTQAGSTPRLPTANEQPRPHHRHRPRLPVDATLIPGRAVEPIDLANALKLAGGRDLDIAIARQRILQAAADLKQARALWLPSLFYGPTWYRADGQIQTITGQVQTIDRSSLFLAQGGHGQLVSRHRLPGLASPP